MNSRVDEDLFSGAIGADESAAQLPPTSVTTAEATLRSHLMLEMSALLKLDFYFAPGDRRRGQCDERFRRYWLGEVDVHDPEVRRLIAENPAFAPRLPQIIAESHQRARVKASNDTNLPINLFDDICVLRAEHLLADDLSPLRVGASTTGRAQATGPP